MHKNYDHQSSEDKIYEAWEKSGRMKADALSPKPKYTIPIPPPNVTGTLHLGHAAMLAIEDILIRYKKMSGYEALWIPGTDHAAIATENVVLKHLGLKSREELSREDFLSECRKFAGEKHDRIVNQMKKMGAWLDWSREAYTFDEERNTAVNHIFKKLYEDGLVVRGHRMINWSTGAQSVLSDDELEWEENETMFYEFWCGPFLIGTVRTETKCADSPLVVNPEAEYVRAKNAEGRELIVSKYCWEDRTELRKDFDLVEIIKKGKDLEGMEFEYETYAGKRKFYVLADKVVDPKFGTGAMTISTSHDPHDFDMAQRYKLDMLQKIDFNGKMTAITGPCEGMTVKKARIRAAEIMEEKGLLFHKRPHTNRVPKCYRSGCVVEPMVSPQWFISVEKEFTDEFTGKKTTLKKQMQEAVREKHVEIIPKRFEKVYFRWIDNLRDWCISRQIWWGHRIPVWYDEHQKIVAVGSRTEDQKKQNLTQDEDTLDTWFSSALWPFSTVGWPNLDDPDFNTFYPNDVLETGHDIIFFWVARMIMFGRYATGKYPFHTVYLHGMVCDEKGKKMSKSKGNGIDPLEVISEVGADAVRLSLVIGSTPGNPISLGKAKIEGYRNFVNKMWNAGRFVQIQLGDSKPGLAPSPVLNPGSLSEKWISSRLSEVSASVSQKLDSYDISGAGDEIYHFVWDEFCNWFLECQKVEKNPEFLYQIFAKVLKLAHPLVPFVTEKLWEELYSQPGLSSDSNLFLIEQGFPALKFEDKKACDLFAKMQDIVTEIRKIRAEKGLNPKEKLSVVIKAKDAIILGQAKELITVLANLSDLTISKEAEKPEDSVVILLDGMEVFVEIPFDVAAEKARLEKALSGLQKQIGGLEGRLSNKKYVENAPEKLVIETRDRLEKLETEKEKVEKELKNL